MRLDAFILLKLLQENLAFRINLTGTLGKLHVKMLLDTLYKSLWSRVSEYKLQATFI